MSRTHFFSVALVLASALLSGCGDRMGYGESEPIVIFDANENACFTYDDEGEAVQVPCDAFPGLSPTNEDPKTMGCQMGQCCDTFNEGTCP